MTEEKNVDKLLKQIEEFNQTIKGLADNVATLKHKLEDNKTKYGPDINQWPKEEQ